jgi:D-alanyl-D-alanine carboxypeptidase (penicillin-binding protein 5/6)
MVLGAMVLVSPFFMKEDAPIAITEAPAIVPTAASDAFQDVTIEGKAAIVYDLVTGETLYEKNSRSQLPLASLTKLLTVYAAAGALTKDAPVTMTDSALASEGDSGFSAGESFSFTDLARLVLVSSSNDATAAIAESAAIARATSGKNMLASAASAAGLAQTYALNGTGLDESTSVAGGYGSAADIAKLTGALLSEAPEIANASIKSSITIRSREGVTHTLPATNPGIVRVSSALLSKTGYTDLAGGNLAVVYDAGIGHPVAIVVLGSSIEGRFTDVNRLLNRANEYFAGISTP